ncbi:putative secreted peptide [Aspergillus novofumigatus IBT 16806]|uniref:Uncharacterized protein n=1 Tax=Aspergillus novofumigatus (strain IBT 16806) TaxID=1392255 RepID=A0A2I1CEZ6_ASPN1|nr:uncharacterized protein P174DRAFT_450488 [Aspergillus novofumigatus IBT 16806]PKX96206.1 hypothetical protein P174DRAFT_450488 [Aspergillus novofumigatus IBT 16806]
MTAAPTILGGYKGPYSTTPQVHIHLVIKMKFSIIALAFFGSALAAPATSTPTPSSTPAASSSYAASSSHIASSTASPSATPTFQPGCDIEHVGNNGKHLGWCKKAKHYGTYKNGTSI